MWRSNGNFWLQIKQEELHHYLDPYHFLSGFPSPRLLLDSSVHVIFHSWTVLTCRSWKSVTQGPVQAVVCCKDPHNNPRWNQSSDTSISWGILFNSQGQADNIHWTSFPTIYTTTEWWPSHQIFPDEKSEIHLGQTNITFCQVERSWCWYGL